MARRVALALVGWSCIFALSAASPTPSAVVSLKDGPVSGTQVDEFVSEWKGIPFAAPPVGDLRFRPPQPVKPWAPQTLDATEFKHNCLQSSSPNFMGWPQPIETLSEDCL